MLLLHRFQNDNTVLNLPSITIRQTRDCLRCTTKPLGTYHGPGGFPLSVGMTARLLLLHRPPNDFGSICCHVLTGQTMDATDTAAPETRYCGRSQALLYNTIRPHASIGYKPPAPELFVPAFAAWPPALRPPAPPATLAQGPTLKLTFHLDHSAGADHGHLRNLLAARAHLTWQVERVARPSGASVSCRPSPDRHHWG